MARAKTSSEKPQQNRGKRAKPQAAASDAAETQEVERGSKRDAELPPWATAAGLPLAEAIVVFASDADKAAAANYKAERDSERRATKQMHYDEINNIDAEIKRLKKFKWYDNKAAKYWLLRSSNNADAANQAGIAAWKAQNQNNDYDNWFNIEIQHRNYSESEEEEKLRQRKHARQTNGMRREEQEQYDREDEADTQTAILATSLVAKLKSGQRIAIGRVNGAENWSVIPASDWNDEWSFFDRSNRVARKSPPTTIKNVRILRPEDLATNDKASVNVEKNPRGAGPKIDILWQYLHPWAAEVEQGKRALPKLLKSAFYDFVNFLRKLTVIGKNEKAGSETQFKDHLKELYPHLYERIASARANQPK